jgi:hypothetical protein
MTFGLFTEVALARDMPDEGLCRDDVATVVDHFSAADGEDGYALEIFNALGETKRVVVVPASAIRALGVGDVWAVRVLS